MLLASLWGSLHLLFLESGILPTLQIVLWAACRAPGVWLSSELSWELQPRAEKIRLMCYCEFLAEVSDRADKDLGCVCLMWSNGFRELFYSFLWFCLIFFILDSFLPTFLVLFECQLIVSCVDGSCLGKKSQMKHSTIF